MLTYEKSKPRRYSKQRTRATPIVIMCFLSVFTITISIFLISLARSHAYNRQEKFIPVVINTWAFTDSTAKGKKTGAFAELEVFFPMEVITRYTTVKIDNFSSTSQSSVKYMTQLWLSNIIPTTTSLAINKTRGAVSRSFNLPQMKFTSKVFLFSMGKSVSQEIISLRCSRSRMQGL